MSTGCIFVVHREAGFANTDADANREITPAKSFPRVIKLLTICESDEFTTGSVIVFHI